MPRYELRPVGVFDNESGKLLSRGSPGWRDYLRWLAEGNELGQPAPPPTPSIEERRDAMRARINTLRARRLAGGLTYEGNVYDTDEASRANLTAVVAAVAAGIPLPVGFTWRTSDNRDVPFDALGLIALGGAMLAHGEACYARSWQLKAEVDSSEAPESIDIESAWPT